MHRDPFFGCHSWGPKKFKLKIIKIQCSLVEFFVYKGTKSFFSSFCSHVSFGMGVHMLHMEHTASEGMVLFAKIRASYPPCPSTVQACSEGESGASEFTTDVSDTRRKNRLRQGQGRGNQEHIHRA